VNTNYEYDQVNRLKRMTHGTIENFKYEYNVDNEISAITSLNSSTQLASDKNSSGANNANRITQFGDSTFAFDDRGQTTTQTTSSGTSTYSWDVRGRLKNVALPNGQSVSYNYDALGRRTTRTSNNQTTNFIYDGKDVVVDKQGNNEVDYVNGLGMDDKLKISDKYFLTDHLGSTIGLTNSNGSLVESQKYEAFGKASGSLSTRYGFTGREYDSDTKLNYYRARWYDAEQGRFISQDPIGFKSGMNFYSYVSNTPLIKTDPSGNIGLPFLSLFPSKPKEECSESKSCEKDIALMEKTFQESIEFMNNNYNRSWGPFTGFMGTFKGSSETNRPACFDQANFVREKLSGNPYENSWSFGLEQFDLYQGPYYAFHTWVIASSAKCGTRRFDPWLGFSHNFKTPEVLL
jgi:RHS repeat-associated protein